MPNISRIERQRIIILMVVVLVVIVAFAIALNNSTIFNRLYSDLFLRWHATTKLFSEGRNLYDPKNADEMWELAFGQNPWGYETNFFYPAHLLIFIAPLALLPYQAAHLIWTIAVQIFYFASLFLLARRNKWPSNSTAMGIFVILNVISLPYIFHTIWGQFNTIGMIGLVLCFFALCDERYALAGVYAVSLTFKPQNDFLALVFLLFWALWQKKRWPFFLGFGAACFLCWLFAELLQHGWVMAFVASLGHYTHTESALDQLWNPNQIIAVLLSLGSFSIFFWKRRETPGSVAFVACLMVSMAVWDLVVPIYGWVHSVFLILTIVWLVPLWKKYFPAYGNYPIVAFVSLLVFGWLSFFLNFLFPAVKPLIWAEMTYRLVLPLVVVAFSITLLWQKDTSDLPVSG